MNQLFGSAANRFVEYNMRLFIAVFGSIKPQYNSIMIVIVKNIDEFFQIIYNANKAVQITIVS